MIDAPVVWTPASWCPSASCEARRCDHEPQQAEAGARAFASESSVKPQSYRGGAVSDRLERRAGWDGTRGERGHQWGPHLARPVSPLPVVDAAIGATCISLPRGAPIRAAGLDGLLRRPSASAPAAPVSIGPPRPHPMRGARDESAERLARQHLLRGPSASPAPCRRRWPLLDGRTRPSERQSHPRRVHQTSAG